MAVANRHTGAYAKETTLNIDDARIGLSFILLKGFVCHYWISVMFDRVIGKVGE